MKISIFLTNELNLCCENYSMEETIQGKKLFAEIKYLKSRTNGLNNISSTSTSNGSLIDQKLLDIIVSQTLCSLIWSALIKTDPFGTPYSAFKYICMFLLAFYDKYTRFILSSKRKQMIIRKTHTVHANMISYSEAIS